MSEVSTDDGTSSRAEQLSDSTRSEKCSQESTQVEQAVPEEVILPKADDIVVRTNDTSSHSHGGSRACASCKRCSRSGHAGKCGRMENGANQKNRTYNGRTLKVKKGNMKRPASPHRPPTLPPDARTTLRRFRASGVTQAQAGANAQGVAASMEGPTSEERFGNEEAMAEDLLALALLSAEVRRRGVLMLRERGFAIHLQQIYSRPPTPLLVSRLRSLEKDLRGLERIIAKTRARVCASVPRTLHRPLQHTIANRTVPAGSPVTVPIETSGKQPRL